MNLEIAYAQFGVKPPVTKPIPEFLIEVGEAGIRELVDKHYETIRGSEIEFLFPRDLVGFENAKEHAAEILSGGQHRGKGLLRDTNKGDIGL